MKGVIAKQVYSLHGPMMARPLWIKIKNPLTASGKAEETGLKRNRLEVYNVPSLVLWQTSLNGLKRRFNES